MKDFEAEDHQAGLQLGFQIAIRAKRQAPTQPDMPARDAQRAVDDAVRAALEAEVVRVLFSTSSDAYLEGLLRATKTITAPEGPKGPKGGGR